MTNSDASPRRDARGADVLNSRLIFLSLRRHPIVVAGILLLTAATAAGIWWLVPLPRQTGSVVFHVASQQPVVLTPPAEGRVDFSIYRSTQAALVKKRHVLAVAIDDPKVRQLPAVREQVDPVGWLERRIVVDFRSGSELMRVTAEGDDSEELLVLLQAVARAYLAEADERENGPRRRRLAKLEEVERSHRKRLDGVQREIDGIALRLGSKDGATLALTDQMAREELASANRELVEIESRLQTMPKPDAKRPARGTKPISQTTLDDRLKKEPTLTELQAEVAKAQSKVKSIERVLKPGVVTATLSRAQEELQAAQDELNRAREELRPRVEAALREEADAEDEKQFVQSQDAAGRLGQQREILAGRIQEIRKKMADTNHARIELENLRLETAQSEKFAGAIADEADRLRLELDAPPRVTLAEEPYVADGIQGNRRLKITLAGVLLVFVAGFGSLVLWEATHRRVSRASEASDGLGLRLLGTVPSGGAGLRLPPAGLAEAIDTTRTMILFGLADRHVRTLMVTSAVDGEGKTSLAGHLAISLTRAGFRTLLVDGDLQAPSAHSLFNVPASPGLCELLREEASPLEAVRATSLPGLSVLPAGEWNLMARQALAGHRWASVKAELERDFDFVVVDTGPVLLVSDSLLMARDADGVLLSVLVDVSRVGSVEETRDRLKTVGANVLGVVVNGVVTPPYPAARRRGSASSRPVAGLPV